MSTNKVKFISYDGAYPNLCSGTLKLEIEGKKYSLYNVLVSGGCACFDKDWDEHVSSGPCGIDLNNYKDLEAYKDDILNVVNENISFGCCGGCV